MRPQGRPKMGYWLFLPPLAAVDEYFLVFITLITFMELAFRATKAAFRASKTAAVATTASIAHRRSRRCVTASNINATHITYSRLFGQRVRRG